MIELVHVTRHMLGTEWTREDRAIILARHDRVRMVSHDLTDAIDMRAQTRIGQYAARLIAASAAPVKS